MEDTEEPQRQTVQYVEGRTNQRIGLETEGESVLELQVRLWEEGCRQPRTVDIRCGVFVRMHEETEGEEEVLRGEGVRESGYLDSRHCDYAFWEDNFGLNCVVMRLLSSVYSNTNNENLQEPYIQEENGLPLYAGSSRQVCRRTNPAQYCWIESPVFDST